jgi:hypothetical protein
MQIANNSIKIANIQYDNFGQLAKQSRFENGKLIIETKNKFDELGCLTNISSIICGIASGLVKAYLGCLSKFASEVGTKFETVLIAIITQVYGENTANICRMII